MPSVHRHAPIGWRPPEDMRTWVTAYADATGLAVSAIITEAMDAYRRTHDTAGDQPPAPDDDG